MIWIKDYRGIGGDLSGGADVWFTDGTYVITCFKYPFEPSENYHGLLGFEGSAIVRSDVTGEIFTRLANGNHFVVGKVINRAEGLVQLGCFTFDCAVSLPKDIEENEFVEFTAETIDLIE